MGYHVNITDSALADASAYFRFLRDERQAPDAAMRWYLGLMKAIDSLSEMPQRCPVIPEAGEFEQELRHLHYHSHRIVFVLQEEAATVIVLRVYHGARDRLRKCRRRE